MYRFSNGNVFSGKSELSRSYIVCIVQSKDTMKNNSDIWKFHRNMPDGSRIYFSNFYGEIKIFKKPLEESYYSHIINEISSFKVDEKHPAIKNGLENEARRLYPNIDKITEKKYVEFIDYLNNNFNLEKNILDQKKFSNFTYDIGPFMAGKVGTRKFIVPEIPKLYLAPENWRKITWYINNYFTGPYPEKIYNKTKKYFSWGDLKIEDKLKNKNFESLSCFLISQFIIIYEAWMKRETCDSLIEFIDIVKNKKQSPWKILY